MAADLINYIGETGAKSSIGGTALQMTPNDFKTKRGVVIKAAAANTGTVYVGFSSAVTAGTADATDGFPLAAGEALSLQIDEPNKLFVIGSASGQKVFFSAI